MWCDCLTLFSWHHLVLKEYIDYKVSSFQPIVISTVALNRRKLNWTVTVWKVDYRRIPSVWSSLQCLACVPWIVQIQSSTSKCEVNKLLFYVYRMHLTHALVSNDIFTSHFDMQETTRLYFGWFGQSMLFMLSQIPYIYKCLDKDMHKSW